MKHKILITGGCGYIGSHVSYELNESGYDCVVYDNLSRGNKESIKDIFFVEGDIQDRVKLSNLFKIHKFDAIVHLAALAYVGESIEKPLEYWNNNFIGTKTLLEESIKSGIRHFIFSSTCSVYENFKNLPISELNPTNPISPYAQSKLACEQLMDSFDNLGLLKSIRFRYFNAAGADYLNNLGESHEPETHLIPLLIDCAFGKREKFIVFGDDYPTKDGSAIRDFIHVSDLAIAHKKGVEYLLGGGETQVVNLGTGKGYSVFEIIEIVKQLTSKNFSYEIQSRRPGDHGELIADYSKAKELLNWQPTKNIKEIINDAIAWHQLIKKL
jgi:UDP-glucose 4-epimerase